MVKPNEARRKDDLRTNRVQKQASAVMRGTREELSAARRHIYSQGTYAPEATTKGHRGPLTAAEVERVRRLKLSGLSHLKVAEEMDISPSTVRAVCARFNIPSAVKARGGWGTKKEDGNAPADPPDSRQQSDLVAHSAGVCGDDCRYGRHAARDRTPGSHGLHLVHDPVSGIAAQRGHLGGEAARRTNRPGRQ